MPREALRSGGFTLVELLVVIGISSVMLTTLVIQQSAWNDKLAVSTQIYDLALNIRQTQIYSLGVKEDVSASGDKFDNGYGIYFDRATPSQYILFADRNDNSRYDAAANEAIETKTYGRGVTMVRVCTRHLTLLPGTYLCSDNSPGNVYKASVIFKRPNPTAAFTVLNQIGVLGSFKPELFICLISPGGREYSVKIEGGGQVSIKQYTGTTCPY